METVIFPLSAIQKILIGCSYRVSSTETLHFLLVITVGIRTVLVTETEESNLAQKSDFLLKIKIDREPDAFNMLATASTLAVIAVFDAMSITLANHNGYTKEEFLVIHPGGEVGERLFAQTGN